MSVCWTLPKLITAHHHAVCRDAEGDVDPWADMPPTGIKKGDNTPKPRQWTIQRAQHATRPWHRQSVKWYWDTSCTVRVTSHNPHTICDVVWIEGRGGGDVAAPEFAPKTSIVGQQTLWVVVWLCIGPLMRCVCVTDGPLWMWGENHDGQLGDGTTENKNSPVQVTVTGCSNVSQIALGGSHSAALCAGMPVP